MKPSAKIFCESGKFHFEIVDLDDFVEYNVEKLYESLYISQGYASESAADRSSKSWTAKFNNATPRAKAITCGYHCPLL